MMAMNELCCQKCKKLIQLDPSLSTFESVEALSRELVKEGILTEREAESFVGINVENPSSATSTAVGGPATTNVVAAGESGGNAAVVGKDLNLSSVLNTVPPSAASTSNEKFSAAEKLFEFTSDETATDHPLCSECTQALFRDLDKQLRDFEEENESYKQFLEQLAEEDERQPSEQDLDEEIEKLILEEQNLKQEFLKVENERNLRRQELERLEMEVKKIECIEERYWQNYSEFQWELENFKEERAAIKRKIDAATEHLERLKKTNVYNDTFFIWHEGHFGTINNFRLGKLPSQPVEWNEINAAWGQAALLLYTIARKIGYQFHTFKIVPMGSTSRIEVDERTSYELYGSNDISLRKIFFNRSFDNAMVAYIACLKQICDHIRTTDPTFSIPFAIEDDRVGDMKIRTQFNDDETWTKALKFTLINLKTLLTWVARKY